jgi:hypothetical protein
MRHVITLSSIPPRFGQLGPALRALRAQSSRPEAIELYIPQSYRRFPQWGGGLPEVPDGVTIVRIEEDFGPATKVLPAARAYRGQDVELLFVDDDILFRPDWAALCLGLRKTHPNAVVCGAAATVRRFGRDWSETRPQPRAVPAPDGNRQLGYHLRQLARQALPFPKAGPILTTPYRKLDRSGYAEIALGFGGVLLRPEFLDDVAFVLPPVLWTVDDVWLSGHLTRRGIPIWADQTLDKGRTVLEVSRQQALFHAKIEGADRDAANLACIDYFRRTYGIWGGVATQST